MTSSRRDSPTAAFAGNLADRQGDRYPGTRKRVEGWIMSLNIKNAETYHLVQELAVLTGETQTMAVTIAVRERLERVRHLREAGLADRLLAIGADTAPRLHEPWRSADHGDLLYDDRGLPG
jgi:antitoxin VapB